jgi:hypothetical protein
MKTVKEKLDELIDAEIEHLNSLSLHDNYNELYHIIYNKFGYKDLTDDEIEEQYQVIFEEEENPDTEPDYNAKTSQELSDEQREIYRTLK